MGTAPPHEQQPDQTFSKTQTAWVYGLAFATVILTWTSIKINLPALPHLADVFKCPPAGLKMSVSLFLIAFALSQLGWGGAVQKFGRRPTLVTGLALATLGSVVTMLSFDLTTYIVGRTLEGVGMGSVSPVSRTILTDVFKRKELARRMATVSGTAAAMPAIAPLVGGYLMTWIGWRAIFALLLCGSLVLMVIVKRRLPRTEPPHFNPAAVTWRALMTDYFGILRTTDFWGFALCYSAMTGGLLGYYAAMPYWFVAQLKIPEDSYAYMAVPTVGMYVVGLWLSRRLVRIKDLEYLLLYGMLVAAGAVTAATALALAGVTGATGIVIALSLYGLAAGFVFPAANAGVQARFKEVAGPTSALMAVTIFTTSSLTSIVAMNLSVATLWPVIAYLGGLSAIGLAAGLGWVWRPYVRKNAGAK